MTEADNKIVSTGLRKGWEMRKDYGEKNSHGYSRLTEQLHGRPLERPPSDWHIGRDALIPVKVNLDSYRTEVFNVERNEFGLR